jgi:hypothetical protein
VPQFVTAITIVEAPHYDVKRLFVNREQFRWEAASGRLGPASVGLYEAEGTGHCDTRLTLNMPNANFYPLLAPARRMQ